ncbi:hypothetical protein [uncultured Roseobacter sp.]|uniref:hypothetical protein n=1 Tax=uncultured Roseobacter sp. TaxID=114847 RepID=UPI0026292D18|nr:hypothetical protein [uncultured Roseobacter sp.]
MIRRRQLPTIDQLRSEITVASSNIAGWAAIEDKRHRLSSGVPPKPDMAPLLASVSADITRLQPIEKGRGMTVEQLAERSTIYRLVASQGQDAEDVIALFKDRDAARALWLRAEAIRGQIDRYETEAEAYRRAMSDWEQNGNIPRYHEDEDLVGILRETEPHDRDLWHVIACESEPGRKADHDALYWIFAQPACDKASVAAFIQRYASAGYLEYLAKAGQKHGHTEFADQTAQIIQRWNDGFYKTSEFGFAGKDLETVEQAFLRQRDRAEEILGRTPWGVPDGLFRSFEGRAPAPALHFRHGDGLMKLPPRPEDFFTSLATGGS